MKDVVCLLMEGPDCTYPPLVSSRGDPPANYLYIPPLVGSRGDLPANYLQLVGSRGDSPANYLQLVGSRGDLPANYLQLVGSRGDSPANIPCCLEPYVYGDPIYEHVRLQYTYHSQVVVWPLATKPWILKYVEWMVGGVAIELDG